MNEERKLAHIESLIEKGRPSLLTIMRLNSICKKLRKLALKQAPSSLHNLVIVLLLLLVVNGRGTSYSTAFATAENPLSENGVWIEGAVTGIDWCNVQAINGHAAGTQVDADNYNDSTAVLSGNWGSDQSVQATVITGDNWQDSVEEVELRLRTSIAADFITGYEFDFRVASPGGYVAIVRWNGSINDFTSLDEGNNNYQGIKTGDVILATASGDLLSAYVNGVLVAQVRDSTYADGSPGVGFWMSGPGDNASFGLTNFNATDAGPNPIPTPTPEPTPSSTPTPFRHHHR
jgi:hypothetical protein